MRPRLFIPDDDVPILAELCELAPEVIDKISESVKDALTLRAVEGALQGAGMSDPVAAAETLLNLARSARRFDSESLGKDFMTMLSEELATRWTEAAIEKWKAVDPSLRQLVTVQLRTLAKSIQLQYEHTNIFADAQLVTDIRPVFGHDDRPIAGIVCQTLRIEYRSEGQMKHLAIALDVRDLARVRSACERAETKAKVLEEYLGKPYAIIAKVPGANDE